MPELPEVETVRRSLRGIIGVRIAAVEVFRPLVICGQRTEEALLVGAQIGALARRGKELLILSDGRAMAVHLGMTGSLRHVLKPALAPDSKFAKHVHVRWSLADGGVLEFHDPRRFGGIWTFPDSAAARQARWGKLGPDAQHIAAAELYDRLQRTRRAIKAALLDQHLVAGLGNIYADELLFACRIRPTIPANRLTPAHARQLVTVMRALLRRAIAARGSSVRDYTDARGQAGRFQLRHQVYGRYGQPCRRCKTILRAMRVGGRTSTYCPRCQPPRLAGAR